MVGTDQTPINFLTRQYDVELKWLPNAFIKSVKFVERPTLDQLQREVALLDNCLDHICSCRSNLDLMLTLEILYE